MAWVYLRSILRSTLIVNNNTIRRCNYSIHSLPYDLHSLRRQSSKMNSSSEGSSFCTPSGMMMTANFNTKNMPVINPTDHTSSSSTGSNQIIGTSADNALGQNATGNSANDSTTDNHNHRSSSGSGSMNQHDHNSMNHHDHSSHSMSMMSQGTVMYMDGFQSALFHNSQNPPPCLNFLHPSVRCV